MVTDIRYTEKQTGEAVKVSTAWAWGDGQARAIVTYESGRRWVLTYDELGRHFDMVKPQEVGFCSFGSHTDRPTPEQRELDADCYA